MLLVIGLGNPGERYAGTRHNVGFDVVASAAAQRGIRLRRPLFRRFRFGRTRDLLLAEPLTYMNRSGEVVPQLLARAHLDPTSLERILVVCDNMDLPVGSVRLKRSGASVSHKGIASIVDALGTGAFPRLYIGIGRPSDGTSVVEHVLSRPSPKESDAYERAIASAAEAVLALTHEEFEDVLNRVNSRT